MKQKIKCFLGWHYPLVVLKNTRMPGLKRYYAYCEGCKSVVSLPFVEPKD